MITNCTCYQKSEQWEFESYLGCWYVVRFCNECDYYWEGPDHSKTNPSAVPTGQVLMVDLTIKTESIRDRNGTFKIYCFDDNGRYGRPVPLDDVQEIYNFCELNKFSHNEISVVTTEDVIVVSVVRGKYVFPPEWQRFN